MMKKILFSCVAATCIFGSLYAADFDLGISGSDKGISGFSLSVGEYYRAPAEEIRIIRRSLPEDEMSVVYYLARKGHKTSDAILKMRLAGKSWWDITLSLGLRPTEVYVVETRRHSGPPYGKAFGHHKKDKGYILKDGEIIELVNTKFLAAKYNKSYDEVIDMRHSGRGYADIDDDFRGKKPKKEKPQKDRDRDNRGQDDGDDRLGKGHGNGHGKGRD